MGVRARQRPDKPGWWLFINHRGQQKKKHFTDKDTALKVARQVRERIALGAFSIESPNSQRFPFRSYYQHWLKTYAQSALKPSTQAFYTTAYKVHLLPALEDTDIREITHKQLKDFVYAKLSSGLSRNSVQGYLAPLSEMFNHAMEDGHVERNPCQHLLRYTRRQQAERHEKIDYLTREEVANLMETCAAHFSQHYALILLLVRTGLRIGEAIALQWQDLHFDERYIQVRRNWVKRVLTSPKPGKWRRVDMSLHLMETLQVLHLERKKETLRCGRKEMPPWVFPTTTGTVINPDNFRYRVWLSILMRAGIRRIRMHDLRHTFASLLIQQGESLAYVRDQMGHHSIRVTVDTYGHLVPGGNRAAVDKLDEPVTPKEKKTA